ncbi:hypothetical protein BKA69DRAFT_1086883 [Paraphysoderma sedebokerense]|nr:hypothetical protein BKA69DRAFT_1086883 [Paraphysoderma sedebokerense]
MEKCRQKMERMLAVNVAKEEIQLLPDKSDQVLSPSTIVCDLEFVKEAFQSGAVPTIRVVRKSSASTPTVNIPEESENTANHRLTILRDRPARQANTLSVYATVSNYTSDYLAMYHKSQEDAGARMNIVVRVQMPHGLSPNMVISKRMTTGALLIKAIAKMNSMTKQTLDSSDCRLQIPSLDEELHMDDIIDELDYVNRCIAQNEIPTFIISLRDPGALGDNQKPLPPLPLVVKPPQLPIVNISNPEPDLDSSTAFILSPTSPTSPSYEPTNMIRSRRSPSDAERPVTRISPEDVLRQSIQSESVVEFYEPLPSPISSTGKRSSTASRILMRPESVSSVRSTSPQVFAISFIIPQKEISYQVQDPMRLDFKFTGDESIFSIKESLWKSKDFPQLRYEMNQYSLQYVHPKTKHRVEILDEDQVLRTLSTYREFHHSDLTIHLCSKKKDVGPKAQQLSKGIGNLINFSLYRFDSLKNPEIDLVRRRLNNVSRDVKTNSKDSHIQDISANIESSKVPPHILSKLAGVSCKLHLRVHLPLENHVVKTVSCDAYDTPSEIIQRVLSKYKKFLRNGDNDEKFYFKISGVQEYLVPESSMINYAYVRRQFCKGERIVLTLTTLPNVSEADEDNEEELDKEACYVEESPDSVGSHSEVTIMGRDVNSIKWMSLWDITSSFKIYIHKCEFPNQASLTIDAIYVEAALLLGSQLLCQPVKTRVLDIAPILRWNSTLDFVFPMYNLPKNTKLCLTLFARANTRKKGEPDRESDYSPLGWASTLLIDRRGLLRQGAISLKLWKTEQLNSINATVSAKRDSDPTLQIRLEEYTHPVVFPCMDDVIDSEPIGKDRQVDINPPDQRMVREILSYDSLVPLEEVEKTIIWRNRYPVINMPNGLLKVLISARWHLLEDVLEVKRMLRICKPIPPESALGLLDSTFADDHVRSYAVDRLAEMPDDDLIDYILQLVQALKYESRLDSKLARFLLRRALANTTVGHHFFWHLKSEMDHPESSILCAVLLEAYLRGNPKHLKQLTRASSLIYKLRDVAMAVKNLKTPPERKAVMVNMMSSINIPGDIALPLDPRFLVKNLVVDKCKYMDSKKLPLWCVFKNDDATGHDIYAIFKSGDDLRQDMLCLQMIRIMDKLWQREGLDLKMIPYKCITTGHEMGMIEVVLHSATVSSIQLSYGGSTAAFKEEPLEEWIRKHNPDEDDYDKAVETFTLSCAGYCVATYCLGIGDRHNDNIMCSKRGNLFHIDFGHFLGNTKRKFGIKRERAPFVLTPDFIYVISKKDSANFSQFLDLCIRAYLILRRHANTFITLFALMLTTGIPELRTVDDLAYLRDAFCLGLSEEEAADEFRSCIFESIRLGWSTQLNWWVHNLVHAK